MAAAVDLLYTHTHTHSLEGSNLMSGFIHIIRYYSSQVHYEQALDNINKHSESKKKSERYFNLLIKMHYVFRITEYSQTSVIDQLNAHILVL